MQNLCARKHRGSDSDLVGIRRTYESRETTTSCSILACRCLLLKVYMARNNTLPSLHVSKPAAALVYKVHSYLSVC
jgi:hypothetical protein